MLKFSPGQASRAKSSLTSAEKALIAAELTNAFKPDFTDSCSAKGPMGTALVPGHGFVSCISTDVSDTAQAGHLTMNYYAPQCHSIDNGDMAQAGPSTRKLPGFFPCI